MSCPADWDYPCPFQGAQQMPLEVKVVEVVDLLEKLGVGVLGHHGLQFHEGSPHVDHCIKIHQASIFHGISWYFIVFHSIS
jgi:hypothetical protein